MKRLFAVPASTEEWFFLIMQCVLAIAGGWALVYDVRQVIMGITDLSQHTPFIVPVFAAAFIIAIEVVVRSTRKHVINSKREKEVRQ